MARGLKPGQTNNPDGRPKGKPNKVTLELRQGVQAFLENNWPAVQADFDRLEARDRLTFILKLMEYVLPRQRTIDSTVMLGKKIDQLNEHQINLLIDNILDGNGE